MAKIEAPIDPDAVVGDFYVFLGRYRPLALRWHQLALEQLSDCLDGGHIVEGLL